MFNFHWEMYSFLIVLILGASSGHQFHPELTQLPSYPTTFTVNIYLKSLSEVMENVERVVLSFYLEIRRVDPRIPPLYFPNAPNESIGEDPREACLFLPLHFVWPNEDLEFVYNAIGQQSIAGNQGEIVVCRDGLIIDARMTIVTVQTSLDVNDFPFDHHLIEINFGHYMAGYPFFDFETDIRSYEDYVDSGFRPYTLEDWSIVNYFCFKNRFFYHHNPVMNNRSFITCKIGIQRDPGYVITVFSTPVITVTFVTIIGVFVTTLPLKTASYNHIFQLCLTSLTSFTVLVITLRNFVPPSDHPTRLSVFFFLLIGLVVTAPLLTVIHKKLYVYCERKAPQKAKFVSRLYVCSMLGILFMVFCVIAWFFCATPDVQT